MKILYEKAIAQYYPLDKRALWESVQPILGYIVTRDERNLALKKELAADLLAKDCLDIRKIGSFSWLSNESEVSSPLIGKFKDLLKVAGNNDLIPLLRDKEIATYFKNLTKGELFIRVQAGSLNEKEAVDIIDGLDTFSTWPISDLNKLDPGLKATIQRITTPEILLDLIKDAQCYNYKYLLIQRLIELDAWDTIVESLKLTIPGGVREMQERSDAECFSNTLQFLDDYKRLNPARMIYLAEHFTRSSERRALSEKEKDVVFTPYDLQRFQQLIKEDE